MRFNRFAPALLLILALVFWLFPWMPNWSGFRISTSVFEPESATRDPLIITLQVLAVYYPLALLVGTLSAIRSAPSRWHASFVGISALVPLVTLTGIYLYLLILDRQALHALTVWFYLSHAATLVCVILCIREYKESSV